MKVNLGTIGLAAFGIMWAMGWMPGTAFVCFAGGLALSTLWEINTRLARIERRGQECERSRS